MIDKEDLRRLAQAATPGPWKVVKDHRWPGVHGGDVILGGSFCDYSVPDDEDEAFIAAANPATVIELLDEIERLRTENEAVWLDGYKAACALLAKGEDEDPYGIGSMCSWCAEEIAKDLLLRVDEARRRLKRLTRRR